MSDTFDFYWRVLRNSQELEAVMVVKGGTSYAGVGWRPLSLTAACKGFPYLEDMPENLLAVGNVTETDFEPKPEPESLPSESDHEEAKSSSSSDPVAEPEPSAEPEPTADVTSPTTSAAPSESGHVHHHR